MLEFSTSVEVTDEAALIAAAKIAAIKAGTHPAEEVNEIFDNAPQALEYLIRDFILDLPFIKLNYGECHPSGETLHSLKPRRIKTTDASGNVYFIHKIDAEWHCTQSNGFNYSLSVIVPSDRVMEARFALQDAETDQQAIEALRRISPNRTFEFV